MRELYEELLARPNVAGCYVGHKRTGRRHTRSLAVVCAVDRKVDAAALAAHERIPDEVSWQRTSREAVGLRTDVQELGESGFQDIVAGPGDTLSNVAFANGPGRVTVSTVGVALRHPVHGKVITTAGHAVQDTPGNVSFAPGQRPAVRLQNLRDDGTRTDFSGELVSSSRVEEADYALILPTDGTPVRNLYHDLDPLGSVPYVAQPADVGKGFFALTADEVKPTTLRGVFGVLNIAGFPMRDLLLTDFVTQGGDSGCALTNANSEVCGLLVGFATVDGVRRSVFMSAFWALSLENAELF